MSLACFSERGFIPLCVVKVLLMHYLTESLESEKVRVDPVFGRSMLTYTDKPKPSVETGQSQRKVCCFLKQG